MAYNDKGEEILDQTPVAMPVGFKRPVPLNQRIQEMARAEISRMAAEMGDESFDEADDFNIDDFDPHSPWEEDFDPDVKFIGAREEEIRRGFVKDMDEDKIHKGKAELDKINYELAARKKYDERKKKYWDGVYKRKASAKRAPAEDVEDGEEE